MISACECPVFWTLNTSRFYINFQHFLHTEDEWLDKQYALIMCLNTKLNYQILAQNMILSPVVFQRQWKWHIRSYKISWHWKAIDGMSLVCICQIFSLFKAVSLIKIIEKPFCISPMQNENAFICHFFIVHFIRLFICVTMSHLCLKFSFVTFSSILPLSFIHILFICAIFSVSFVSLGFVRAPPFRLCPSISFMPLRFVYAPPFGLCPPIWFMPLRFFCAPHFQLCLSLLYFSSLFPCVSHCCLCFFPTLRYNMMLMVKVNGVNASMLLALNSQLATFSVFLQQQEI